MGIFALIKYLQKLTLRWNVMRIQLLNRHLWLCSCNTVTTLSSYITIFVMFLIYLVFAVICNMLLGVSHSTTPLAKTSQMTPKSFSFSKYKCRYYIWLDNALIYLRLTDTLYYAKICSMTCYLLYMKSAWRLSSSRHRRNV